EILLADYFTFENEDTSASEYNEESFAGKKDKFRAQILKDLVKAGAADSEEDALDLIESTASADNEKAAAALKKLNYENKLTAYTNALGNISKNTDEASSYYDILSSALALEELNQDKVDLLLAMKNAAAGNEDFCNAADSFAEAMEKSYASISLNVGNEKIVNYAVNSAWESVKSEVSAVAAVTSADAGLDLIFSAEEPALRDMRVLLQYSVNEYAKQAVIDLRGIYDSASGSEAAEDFHSAFTNYVAYQEYSSVKTSEYILTSYNSAETISVANDAANDAIAFSTEIELINTWYKNFLDYTGVKESAEGVPSGAVEYNGHYYMVFNNSISWIYAKEYCELMGGHLATVADAEEQEVVESVAKACTDAENFWIGGYCTKEDPDTWMWVDGTPFEYTNWDVNQPDYHQSEEYYIRFTNKDIQYESWTAYMGKWNDCANEASGNNSKGDAVSIQTFAFICEWDDLESLKDYILGDANIDGKVNVRDAAFIAQKLAQGKANELTIAADFNEDGTINVRDAAAIAKFLATGGK
ncbi:MAG: lectin-like protein, partial [Porcipelethomonas sp.]